jgi:ferredoxin
MDCNCKDGKEMCVDACPEDAILFLPKTDAPGMLKDKEWLPGSIVDSVKTG